MDGVKRNFLRLLVTATLLTSHFLPLASAATENAEEADAPPKSLAIILLQNMWIVFAVVGLVTAVATLVIRLRRHERERLKREEEAAYRFEKQMMKSLGQAMPETESSPSTPSTTPESATPPPPQPDPAALSSPEAPDELALRRLRESGLVESEEDLVMNPGEPPLKFLRLYSGQTAIVFPPDTPFDEATRKEKAADLLILPRSQGDPLMCRSLGAYLSDQLFKT